MISNSHVHISNNRAVSLSATKTSSPLNVAARRQETVTQDMLRSCRPDTPDSPSIEEMLARSQSISPRTLGDVLGAPPNTLSHAAAAQKFGPNSFHAHFAACREENGQRRMKTFIEEGALSPVRKPVSLEALMSTPGTPSNKTQDASSPTVLPDTPPTKQQEVLSRMEERGEFSPLGYGGLERSHAEGKRLAAAMGAISSPPDVKMARQQDGRTPGGTQRRWSADRYYGSQAGMGNDPLVSRPVFFKLFF